MKLNEIKYLIMRRIKIKLFRKLTLGIVFLFAILIKIDAINVPNGQVKILFIGNSFIYMNDMPGMFKQIATNAGKSVIVDQCLWGGQSLQGFWTDSTQIGLNKIKSQAWDYVVLEGWGIEIDPATDMKNYGTLFMDEIHKLYPNAIVLMYMVHSCSTPYPDYNTMNAQQAIFESVAKERPYAELVPVEWAWRQGYIDNPSDLYWRDYNDKWHPGPNRSYISALSMYSTIYLTTPIGLTWNATVPPPTIGFPLNITAGEALTMQTLVWNSLKSYSTIKSVFFSYTKVNINVVTPGTNASLCVGDSVSFGYQPIPGSWSWSGPNNFTSTDREIKFQDASVSQSGNYVATYTSPTGVVSTQTFTITVNIKPAISPFVQIANGTWSQLADNTAIEGQSLKFSPLPRVATGWSWTGPNGFTSILRELSIPVVSQLNEGIYIVTYTNAGGCSDTFSFNISVQSTALNYIPDDLDFVQIYPNPVQRFLFIKNADNAHISISDISGHEILNENCGNQASEFAIDVSWMLKGFYFIKVMHKNNCLTKKFLKI